MGLSQIRKRSVSLQAPQSLVRLMASMKFPCAPIRLQGLPVVSLLKRRPVRQHQRRSWHCHFRPCHRCLNLPLNPKPYYQVFNIGALIIRIGFGGPLYYSYNKEPPKPVLPSLRGSGLRETTGIFQDPAENKASKGGGAPNLNLVFLLSPVLP